MTVESKARSERGARVEPPRRSSALRTSLQIVLAACAVVALLWMFYQVKAVLFILVLSVFFAYLVSPVVTFFSRPIRLFRGKKARTLPLPLAITSAYLTIFGAVTAAVVLLLPVLNSQLSELRGELPAYVTRIEAGWQSWLKGQTRTLPRDLRAGIDGVVNQASAGAVSYFQHDLLPAVGGVLISLPWLVLVPILAFFLLKDGDRLRQAALALFPGRQLRWRGDVFFEDVNRALAGYIRSQLLASLVMTVLSTAGFLAIGVPYAVVLGLLAGLLEFIPLVGPFVVAVLATGLGALESPSHGAMVAVFLLVLRVLQDYVINPKLIGREIPLHPMAVILAILCGGELGGVAGIVLSVPLLAVLTVGFHHWRAHRASEPPRPAIV